MRKAPYLIIPIMCLWEFGKWVVNDNGMFPFAAALATRSTWHPVPAQCPTPAALHSGSSTRCGRAVLCFLPLSQALFFIYIYMWKKFSLQRSTKERALYLFLDKRRLQSIFKETIALILYVDWHWENYVTVKSDRLTKCLFWELVGYDVLSLRNLCSPHSARECQLLFKS